MIGLAKELKYLPKCYLRKYYGKEMIVWIIYMTDQRIEAFIYLDDDSENDD